MFNIWNSDSEKLCRVEEKLSDVRSALKRKQGEDGPYNLLVVCVVIQLGGTEPSARIE